MSEAARAKAPPPPWLRPAFNLTPAVGFLIALVITHQFRSATWVLIALSVVALAASLIIERRIAPVPAFSGGAALLFGGLALALHRNDLLKMKMTFVDLALGAVLFAGLLAKRNPLKFLMDGALVLPDEAWRGLMIRFGAFWWASALANEIVWRTQTDVIWAEFRVAAIIAAVLFGGAQMFFLGKYLSPEAAAHPPEPPEPGF
ncbi:MAG: inner membrane-spanning protein YciB [Caulobacterales bacterium]